ncbi:hypothetical protein PXJ20_19535 [Paraburkholderia sp. A1RI_3L]|uniref:hypothetical protein n=1 Tax=Paraburkholderia TaxID=1822464 RepID=UPI003B8189D8
MSKENVYQIVEGRHGRFLVNPHKKIDWGRLPLSPGNFRTGFSIQRGAPDLRA